MRLAAMRRLAREAMAAAAEGNEIAAPSEALTNFEIYRFVEVKSMAGRTAQVAQLRAKRGGERSAPSTPPEEYRMETRKQRTS